MLLNAGDPVTQAQFDLIRDYVGSHVNFEYYNSQSANVGVSAERALLLGIRRKTVSDKSAVALLELTASGEGAGTGKVWATAHESVHLQKGWEVLKVGSRVFGLCCACVASVH